LNRKRGEKKKEIKSEAGWGPRAGLDVLEKRKISCHFHVAWPLHKHFFISIFSTYTAGSVRNIAFLIEKIR
jgi:hypothetical protein